MNRVLVSAVATACASFAAAQFVSGNLAVSRIGDGSAALTNAGTAVFIDQFTTAGSFVNSLALPTTVIGSNRRVVNSGTATSEGQLTLSNDRLFLAYGGYDAAAGTASIASTTSAANARVAARIDAFANIDTTTALSDAYSANNIRSAVWDVNTFYLSGTSSTAGGVRTAAFGATTSSSISGTLTNVRVTNIFGGQVYTSSASGSNIGINLVSGGVGSLLPGFSAITGQSPYDFWFANASTLYVADDGTGANGGIGKWTFDGSVWNRQYVLGTGATGIGARSLTGVVDGSGGTTLYAVTAEGTGNRLISVLDTGAGSSATTLATASANTIFRGVDFAPVPEPASVAALAVGTLAILRRRKAR